MGTSYHRKSVLTPTRRNNTVVGHRQGGVVPSGQGKEDQGGVGSDRPGSVKRPVFPLAWQLTELCHIRGRTSVLQAQKLAGLGTLLPGKPSRDASAIQDVS